VIGALTLLLGIAPVQADGLDAISAGDRAWYAGDREDAVQEWREALRSDDPAALAMAHLRLLHVSGNFGLILHGPAADRALEDCGTDPWCTLARADWNLWAPVEVGADRAEAARLARSVQADLPGPALARIWLATRDPAALDALASAGRDGLGDGIIALQGQDPHPPGTWTLGVGVVGCAGLGFGGALRFVHPDLAWKAIRLDTEILGTTRGIGEISASVVTSGSPFVTASAQAAHLVTDAWIDDTPTTWTWDSLSGSALAGVRHGHASVRAGPSALWADVDGDVDLMWGPAVSAALDHRRGPPTAVQGWLTQVSGTWNPPALGSTCLHVGGSLEGRGYLGLPGHVTLATRGLVQAVAFPDVPFYLLPSAGGDVVLRGAPAGRFRGPALAALDLEVRRPVGPATEIVVFADGAWVEDAGAHPGGGLGLRLLLPPGHTEVVRVDVAISDVDWAVTTGWGEAF